jgi:hypothetical protein
MANMTPGEPQSAAQYDDRTTAAVKAVLIEIGQVLSAYQGKFALIGGAVPWLLLENEDMRHVGTIDVDLGLDAEALGDGEYATLVESLIDHGYKQSADFRRFQLVRQVPTNDGGGPIDIVIDFLMPRDADIVKNDPPIITDFAVQRADGAELAIHFQEIIAITGPMPDGVRSRVEIAVCSIPALLAMKGFAINKRYKQKDAYDIYYCVRNFPGGPNALAEACLPVLHHANGSGATGYNFIHQKFGDLNDFGPMCVRRFVEDTQALDGRTPEQWQQDAFGQVDAWLRAIGLRV